MAGVAVRDEGLGWGVEFWSGTLVWSGLVLLALALAMSSGGARGPEAEIAPAARESG